jgi:hypothetical protein
MNLALLNLTSSQDQGGLFYMKGTNNTHFLAQKGSIFISHLVLVAI